MILPMIPLKGLTILPGIPIHFDVSRTKSIQALEQALRSDNKLFLVTQKDADTQNPDITMLYLVGTIVTLKQVTRLPNHVVRVLVEGIGRARLVSVSEVASEGYENAVLEEELTPEPDPSANEAMCRQIMEYFLSFAAHYPKLDKNAISRYRLIQNAAMLMDQIAMNLPLDYEKKQEILEAFDLQERFMLLCTHLENETNIALIRDDLTKKIKGRVDANQREYLLREQQKLIREELGESGGLTDTETFEKALSELNASDEVKTKIQKEITRFKNLAGSSSESAVERAYIETLLELPWDKACVDNENMKTAHDILEKEHYGLDKVKERILEFLAVRSLTKKGKSPIICLVGPPGTGKTSIAKSMAKALAKPYIRICLGGVRDEAEIRGHRKTYVGAMPGRIAVGIRQAAVKNPLMLLDEIDKVSNDYKGDTFSALLEVLDSEQNSRFQDHYIEIPIDLSEVLFVATANSTQNIPRPLLDRMEVIEVNSYTENEKYHIAKEHLLKKQMELNGITRQMLTISDSALKKMISVYTREAGVRELERKIGDVCRKVAREILETRQENSDMDLTKIKVSGSNLNLYLGKPKYRVRKVDEKPQVGIVRGLAYTVVGGDTLQIEVNCMPGKGEVILTGQMGDVMKESAQIALSFVRSIGEEHHISSEFFKENDFHIHIPEGAVPKDGPSAGITMATALFSAISGKPVNPKIAMTGEITLRGRVLPIGGLKEKLLAAVIAGVNLVLVPADNRPDVEEITREITENLEIVYVTNMNEVLKAALIS